jgi:hypothetical protein
VSVNSLRDLHLLSRVPADMRPHVWALRDKGVDFDKLLKLVVPPSRGRPRKAALPKAKRRRPFTVMFKEHEWDELVRAYRDHGLASTDRQAIRKFIEEYVRDVYGGKKSAFFKGIPTHGSELMTMDRLVLSLQRRLSRWRTLQK